MWKYDTSRNAEKKRNFRLSEKCCENEDFSRKMSKYNFLEKKCENTTFRERVCYKGDEFSRKCVTTRIFQKWCRKQTTFRQSWEFTLSHFQYLLFRSICSIKKSDWSESLHFSEEWRERMLSLSKEWGEWFTLYERVICSFKERFALLKSDLLQIHSFHHTFPLFMPKTKEQITLHHSSRSL